MKTKKLTFEKALAFLGSLRPVYYSNLRTHDVVFVLPLLPTVDIMRLSKFDNWYVCADFEANVHLVIFF